VTSPAVPLAASAGECPFDNYLIVVLVASTSDAWFPAGKSSSSAALRGWGVKCVARRWIVDTWSGAWLAARAARHQKEPG